MTLDIRATAREMGFTPIDDPIQPGDTYLAKRNCGPKLLTCDHVVTNKFGEPSYIVPRETAYCFDVWECTKVEM